MNWIKAFNIIGNRRRSRENLNRSRSEEI